MDSIITLEHFSLIYKRSLSNASESSGCIIASSWKCLTGQGHVSKLAVSFSEHVLWLYTWDISLISYFSVVVCEENTWNVTFLAQGKSALVFIFLCRNKPNLLQFLSRLLTLCTQEQHKARVCYLVPFRKEAKVIIY
jgi:hypothetical protein